MVVVHALWSADNRLALWVEEADSPDGIVRLLADSAVNGLAHKATAAELDLLLPTGGRLATTRVAVALFDADAALGVLDVLRGKLSLEYDEGGTLAHALLGDSVRFLAELAAVAADFVARRRVLPAIVGTAARWVPAPAPADRERLRALAAAAPPVLRAEDDRPGVLVEALTALTDGAVRAALEPLTLSTTRDSPAGAWLAALTGPDATIAEPDPELAEALDAWHRSAVEASEEVRVCFRLDPPGEEEDQDDWSVEFLVQDVAEPSLVVDTAEIWRSDTALTLFGRHVERPKEALLTELGRASRLWPELDGALRTATPTGLAMDALGAHRFLRSAAPLLAQSGFGVLLPATWQAAGVGLKLTASSPATPGVVQTRSRVGFDALVDYRWQVALGEEVLTRAELAELARAKTPLVRMRGQWVEVDHIRLRKALAFMDSTAGSQLSLADLLGLSAGLRELDVDLPVVGVEATGWVGDLLSGQLDRRLEPVASPAGLATTLRPYQQRGLSWLAFLDDLRLGGVLADDMGLGKTVQTLALLLRDRGRRGGPTLLVCPMSVVGNWQREAARFAPELTVRVHHGSERHKGSLEEADLVITTYAVATRDADLLGRIRWRRVVLDEAQNIKNSATKQSAAVRGLPAEQRIALTGTPVENRLAELWSIVDFVNPGLLGPLPAFRERFAVPIERHGDEQAARRLRKITGPFLLRRVKTDPAIIGDLPDKIEMKVLCNLTPEQASLYQAVVDDMLVKIDNSEGVERRGLVLATMTKLKQVCNHPAHLLKDGTRLPGRSGKLARLEEILEEVLAEGDRALCFTQFTEFGGMLERHLAARFGREVRYLHGGTSKRKRDAMVAEFQSAAGDAGPAIFILSLKAGGTGLNLTAANHVIHVDRWWNPAVEDQATDRAFRIGQRKNVQVRKFVCVGTLEERIDEMIETKKALSRLTVNSGEKWLTELSTDELREVIALSTDAVSE